MSHIIILTTASSEKEAQSIAEELIDSSLAACVNIIPNIRSIYMWKGKRESSPEFLLIIKTNQDCFKSIAEKIKQLHSYDLPEIISIQIADGDESYLKWIDNAVSSKISKGV